MALELVTQHAISLIHPKIREEVTALLEKAESVIDPDYRIRIVQGLRSVEYQNELYAKGRTAPGSIVTKAKGGSSMHNYGLAIDICWLIKQADGSYKYHEKKSWIFGPNYQKVVKIFKEAGYIWGGDWVSIDDKPHFEKSFGLGWRDLYKKYNEKDFIAGTKYLNL